jgi:hypothetical protein
VALLQAYTRTSDDEAIEALVMDRRWQLVLDCEESRRSTTLLGRASILSFVRSEIISRSNSAKSIKGSRIN